MLYDVLRVSHTILVISDNEESFNSYFYFTRGLIFKRTYFTRGLIKRKLPNSLRPHHEIFHFKTVFHHKDKVQFSKVLLYICICNRIQDLLCGACTKFLMHSVINVSILMFFNLCFRSGIVYL